MSKVECPTYSDCVSCVSNSCTYYEKTAKNIGCVWHIKDVEGELTWFVGPGETSECPSPTAHGIIQPYGWDWLSFFVGLFLLVAVCGLVFAWKRYKALLSNCHLRRVAATSSLLSEMEMTPL